ncbi:GyrI-like domain-containing protein [Microtetraspora malaysiensis]|uniref:GyrI-like domain-containing protein n=1 Tax=Microtetraspora malaysiensis TaxID=161358 RepID=UPI003D8BFBC2
MSTPKTDVKKEYRELYTAKPEPGLVLAPELPYLMIDGAGDPSSPGYASAVEALYGVAYAIRFALKGAGVMEYPVMPLQGLWWTEEDHRSDFTAHRDLWQWTMMIMQPPQAGVAMFFDDAVATARKKKPSSPIDRVRLETLREGWCGQILHVGPYSTEAATLERLHTFLEEGGHTINGNHHEIYLSVPGRTAPEKMKTIIRYPVTPAG